MFLASPPLWLLERRDRGLWQRGRDDGQPPQTRQTGEQWQTKFYRRVASLYLDQVEPPPPPKAETTSAARQEASEETKRPAAAHAPKATKTFPADNKLAYLTLQEFESVPKYMKGMMA